MEWKGRRQSDNIEDDRGSSGGLDSNPFGRGGGGMGFPGGGMRRAGGGLSIGMIIFLVVIYLVLKAMGIDMLQVLDQNGGTVASGPGYEQSDGSAPAPANDEMKQFVATILAETEDTWHGIFQAMGKEYEEPKLVLFSGRINSACGLAPLQAASVAAIRASVEDGATRKTRSRSWLSAAASHSPASSGIRSGVISPAPPAAARSRGERARRRTRSTGFQ